MRRAGILVVSTLVVALAAACGIPDSGDFTAIPEDEFPRVIRETRPATTTTTTTTTSTTTTTTVPNTVRTSLPGPTTTAPRTTTTTTTTTTVPTDEIHLYYVQGSGVRAVTVAENSPVTLQRKLLDLTERVGMTSTGARLASVIPVGAVLIGSLDRGVVTIELGSSASNVLPVDQPLFFAQIVLSVLAPTFQGQVVFTQRGLPYPAVTGDGRALEPGAPAAWEDYRDLIIDVPQVTPTTVRTTTTTTTSTTTTVPRQS